MVDGRFEGAVVRPDHREVPAFDTSSLTEWREGTDRIHEMEQMGWVAK